MKAKKLAALLLTLVLALGLIPMGAMAAQTTVTPASTASITVNNAVANDVFAAYKVVDITYNAGNNTLTKTWNTNFAGYFTGTTVEQFAALTDDSQELKNLLAGLPQYIENNHIAPVKTETVTGTTATFADLAMGEYFIRPTSTTSVYQLMLQKIEPTVAKVGGVQTYVIDDVTFNAKHKEVNVAKTADKTSVTKNEKVAYTITVDIPTYLDEATDKTFYVSDLLPDGLTIDITSIKVQVDDANVDAAAYTLNTTAIAGDYTFKLSVSNEQYTNYWKANAGINPLVITYTAKLNNDTTTAVNEKETNTVKFDYSNYPYVDSHVYKTASVDVTTFAIKVNKVDASNNETKLANAEFDLYRTAYYDGEPGSVDIPHLENVKGIKLESGVTDENGALTFAKYEANGNKYKYYLVETKAPSGYNLLNDAVEVHFTDAEVEETAGIYTVKVPNSSGIQLPVTGGMGTVIFTVIGIALMAGAVVLLVFSRKKAKTDGNK